MTTKSKYCIVGRRDDFGHQNDCYTEGEWWLFAALPFLVYQKLLLRALIKPWVVVFERELSYDPSRSPIGDFYRWFGLLSKSPDFKDFFGRRIMLFEKRIQGVFYTVFVVSADNYSVSPTPPQEIEDKLLSVVWAHIVAPNGPNFRGRKVSKRSKYAGFDHGKHNCWNNQKAFSHFIYNGETDSW